MAETRGPILLRENITAAEYETLPEDNRIHHLIDGKLYRLPSPYWDHHDIRSNIGWPLHNYVREHRLGETCALLMDVYLGPHVLQPDILFISRERFPHIVDDYVRAAPEIIVEILEPETAFMDLGRKLEIYLEFGVQEVWIVDPEARKIDVHRPSAPVTSFHEDQIITTPLIPGFGLPITEVFVFKRLG
jgi:Uma2 family endonuclease